MIKDIRKTYNQSFSEAKYRAMIDAINKEWNHVANFRISETPIFIPNSLKNKFIEACADVTKVIVQKNFKELTKGAIKHPSLQVPNEDYHTRFLQVDFGICTDEKGELIPQLIEVQGFPSLYFFQDLLARAYQKYFEIPDNFGVYFEGMNTKEYIDLLHDVIVGNFDPKNVVLLEIEPEKQVTSIDFYDAQYHLE